MRKMEAQAAKTMASIEGVGRALDDAGGENNTFARNTEKMTRGLRDVDRSSGLASRALGVFAGNVRKSNKETGGFVTAMQKLRDVAGGVMALITGMKWSVLSTGIGLAVQAVGALGGGIVALLPRLGDLMGVIAAGPAAFGAFAQSIGTVMLALKPAMAAISAGFKQASKSTDPFQAAMEKLSPQAQRFVKEVIAMRPAFQKLQNAAGIKLFPQLSASLKDLGKLFPTIQRNLTQTGGVVGKSLRGIAGDLSSPERIKDLNLVMQSQTRIAGSAGNGLRNMASALMDLMVAARPFTEWLFRTVEGWTKVAAASAKAGRETGGIASYLDKTRSSLELFGSILKNVWQSFTAIMEAARPLGDRLWEGADKATRGWAKFLRSAEGATKARQYFDSLYEPLHAMGQLAKEATVAIFGMTKDTGPLTATANALRGVVPDLAKWFQGASALGPGVARSLGAIARIMANLAWSPTLLLVEALSRLFEVVSMLMEKIPGLGFVISTLMTVALGTKLVGAVARLASLAGVWNAVAAAATRAGIAQQAAAMAGMGGGARGFTATTGPLQGMVGAGGKAATGGRLAGLAKGLKGGGGLAGLGIGLGGTALSMGLGSIIGGDAGSKVSGIGSMTATGAGIGMLAGPWGALAGAAAGAIVGGITTGLFKGGENAAEAGKKAGEEYMKGLGRAGIDPATGKPWGPGKNPYQSQKDRIQAREDVLAQRRNALAGKAAGTGLYGSTGDALKSIGALRGGDSKEAKALRAAEMNSVAAFTSGITGPRSNKLMNSAKFIVQDFTRQFRALGPQAQEAGAKAMYEWARGMEKSGKATKGFTQRVFQGIAGDFDSISQKFGGTGRKAFNNFKQELRKANVEKALRSSVDKIADHFGDLEKLPMTSLKNWPSQYNKIKDVLTKEARRGSQTAREDLKALERDARRFERLMRRIYGKPTVKTGYAPGQPYQKFDGKSGGPLAPNKQRPKAPSGNPLFAGLFGGSMIPGVNKSIRAKVETGQASKNLAKLSGDAKTAGRSITGMADRALKARGRIKDHSAGMVDSVRQASRAMVEDTNTVFGAIGASPKIVIAGGNAFGGRLPGFASGGRIPGAAMGDHIPLYSRGGGVLGIADGGELVVNRHTEKRVNGMLASHGTSLGREVAGETRPHFEKGGRIGDNHIQGRRVVGGEEAIIRREGRNGNALLGKQLQALNSKIDSMQPKTGLGSFQGHQVSNWIISVLKYAQGKGWGGSITSGYRSVAEQAAIKSRNPRAANPGSSNHNSIDYPGGAVDVGGFEDRAAGSYLNSKIGGFPGKYKLVWGGPAINDWGHFSARGNARGGRLPQFAGWHARGMHGVVSGPTLFGAGERGPERVKVTPVNKKAAGGQGGKGNIEVHIGNIHYSRKGDIAKAIREEMELLGDELAMIGDADE